MKVSFLLFSLFTCTSINGFTQSINNNSNVKDSIKPIYKTKNSTRNVSAKRPLTTKAKVAEPTPEIEPVSTKWSNFLSKSKGAGSGTTTGINKGRVVEGEGKGVGENKPTWPPIYILQYIFKKIEAIKKPKIISDKGWEPLVNSWSKLIIWYIIQLIPILIIAGIFYKIFNGDKFSDRFLKVKRIYKESMQTAANPTKNLNIYGKIWRWLKGIYLFTIQILKEIFVI